MAGKQVGIGAGVIGAALIVSSWAAPAPIPRVAARITAVREQPARASYVVIEGVLDAAAHEEEEGYWAIGPHLGLIVRPNGIPQQILRQFKGKRVELVIREAK